MKRLLIVFGLMPLFGIVNAQSIASDAKAIDVISSETQMVSPYGILKKSESNVVVTPVENQSATALSKANVYPSDSKYALNIEFGNKYGKDFSANVFENSGKRAQNARFSSNLEELNVANLPSGKYVLVIRDEEQRKSLAYRVHIDK